MKKILVAGSQGQIGYELKRTLAPQGKIIATTTQEMDLSDPDSIRKTIRQFSPDIIVNAGAYTAVDRAESDVELCMRVNAEAPGIIAEEAKKLNALFVHYSTDYVFDGSAKKPYDEKDSPNPLNVYGRSKWEGEKSIQHVGGEYLILRTSWVYGRRGKNFLLTMLNLAKTKEHLNVVDDQFGAPTWSRLIAEATAYMVANPKKQFGIYNLTSAGYTTWKGFAEAIFEIQHKKDGCKPPRVNGISTENYPTPAIRPKNSVLSHLKINREFHLYMPDWRESLELCLQD